MKKKTSLLRQIEEISEEMCDKYCKFPDIYAKNFPDEEKAMERLQTECCINCPLMRL